MSPLRAVSTKGLFVLSFRGSAPARTGRQDEAGEILEELPVRDDEDSSLSLRLAVVHAALGDTGEALPELERAVEDPEPIVVGMNTPWLPFRTLQDEPRIQRPQAEVTERTARKLGGSIAPSDDG